LEVKQQSPRRDWSRICGDKQIKGNAIDRQSGDCGRVNI
jgi:hypothetical protein